MGEQRGAESKYPVIASQLTVPPRCTQASFFLKMEFEETRNFKCPSAGCNSVWCKDCQQEITSDGPEHSCDGSLELERLVREKGWKYCPSKFIPITEQGKT